MSQTNAEDEILKTWNEVPITVSSLNIFVKAILSIFSWIYFCELLFFEMKYIKNQKKKVANYEPDRKYLLSN